MNKFFSFAFAHSHTHFGLATGLLSLWNFIFSVWFDMIKSLYWCWIWWWSYQLVIIMLSKNSYKVKVHKVWFHHHQLHHVVKSNYVSLPFKVIHHHHHHHTWEDWTTKIFFLKKKKNFQINQAPNRKWIRIVCRILFFYRCNFLFRFCFDVHWKNKNILIIIFVSSIREE